MIGPKAMMGAIAGVFFAVFIITNAYGVYVSFMQWIIVVFALLGVAGLMLVLEFRDKILKKEEEGNTIGLTHAEDYVRQWWQERFQEDIEVVRARQTVFGEEFCGFVLRRDTGGLKHGLEAVVVVQLHPLKVVDWDDAPSISKTIDPFDGFKTIYPGAPSKVLRADESMQAIGKVPQAPGSVININQDKKEENPWDGNKEEKKK